MPVKGGVIVKLLLVSLATKSKASVSLSPAPSTLIRMFPLNLPSVVIVKTADS